MKIDVMVMIIVTIVLSTFVYALTVEYTDSIQVIVIVVCGLALAFFAHEEGNREGIYRLF